VAAGVSDSVHLVEGIGKIRDARWGHKGSGADSAVLG